MKIFIVVRTFACRFLAVVLLLQAAGVMMFAGGSERSTVVNVRFETSENRIIVHYDLLGAEDELYKTVLTLRKESDSTFAYLPKGLEGDIGEGISAGKDRRIVWVPGDEFPKGLESSDYYFEIRTVTISSSSVSAWLIGIGGAALGGVIWYLSSPGSNDAPPVVPASLPSPPGRPH